MNNIGTVDGAGKFCDGYLAYLSASQDDNFSGALIV